MLKAKTCRGETSVEFSIDEENEKIIDEIRKAKGENAENEVLRLTMNAIDAHVTTALADLSCIISSMYRRLVESNPIGMLAGLQLRKAIVERPEILFSFYDDGKIKNAEDTEKEDWRDSNADFD